MQTLPHRLRDKGPVDAPAVHPRWCLKKTRLLSLFLLVLMIVLSSHAVGQVLRYRKFVGRLIELEQKIADYEQENEALRLQVDKLQDYRYLELVARRELGVVRPEEIVFLIEGAE